MLPRDAGPDAAQIAAAVPRRPRSRGDAAAAERHRRAAGAACPGVRSERRSERRDGRAERRRRARRRRRACHRRPRGGAPPPRPEGLGPPARASLGKRETRRRAGRKRAPGPAATPPPPRRSAVRGAWAPAKDGPAPVRGAPRCSRSSRVSVRSRAAGSLRRVWVRARRRRRRRVPRHAARFRNVRFRDPRGSPRRDTSLPTGYRRRGRGAHTAPRARRRRDRPGPMPTRRRRRRRRGGAGGARGAAALAAGAPAALRARARADTPRATNVSSDARENAHLASAATACRVLGLRGRVKLHVALRRRRRPARGGGGGCGRRRSASAVSVREGPPAEAEDAATHAAGAPARRSLGGSWCRRRGAAADVPNAARRRPGERERARGAEEPSGETADTLTQPPLRGDAFGAAQARAALRALEAAASAEGTAAAAGLRGPARA